MFNKYIRKIKRYAKRYPEQFSLFIYNTGVFVWLKTNAYGIVDLSRFQQGPLKWVSMDHIDSAKNFISSLPYGWLIVSIIATSMLRKVKRKTRRILTIGMIVFGLYFMYGYAKTNGWL